MQNIVYEAPAIPSAADIKALEDGIAAYNMQMAGAVPSYKYVFARNGGTLSGGVSGSLTGYKFHVRHLWVAELQRGKGIGLQLMKQIEAVAKNHGCKHVFVDTMSFQAPGFYEKCGYAEVARIKDFYDEHDRIFFRKGLN